jgi:hypothetical protein
MAQAFSILMKVIKLSGREVAVLRAIENEGNTGEELSERTQLGIPDLADILNGMCDVGYVEAYRGNVPLPMLEPLKVAEVATLRFEINPSYAQQLKHATAHR